MGCARRNHSNPSGGSRLPMPQKVAVRHLPPQSHRPSSARRGNASHATPAEHRPAGSSSGCRSGHLGLFVGLCASRLAHLCVGPDCRAGGLVGRDAMRGRYAARLPARARRWATTTQRGHPPFAASHRRAIPCGLRCWVCGCGSVQGTHCKIWAALSPRSPRRLQRRPSRRQKIPNRACKLSPSASPDPHPQSLHSSPRARGPAFKGFRGFPGDSRRRSGCMPQVSGYRTRIDRPSPSSRGFLVVLSTSR